MTAICQFAVKGGERIPPVVHKTEKDIRDGMQPTKSKSTIMRDEDSLNPIVIKCAYCGKEAVRTWHRQIYCSKDCRRLARRLREGQSDTSIIQPLKWVICSPDGEEFTVIGLQEWLRANQWRFKDTRWQTVATGFTNLKKRMARKPNSTYMGWRILEAGKLDDR